MGGWVREGGTAILVADLENVPGTATFQVDLARELGTRTSQVETKINPALRYVFNANFFKVDLANVHGTAISQADLENERGTVAFLVSPYQNNNIIIFIFN